MKFTENDSDFNKFETEKSKKIDFKERHHTADDI